MLRQWRHSITKTLRERGPRWLAREDDQRYFYVLGAGLDVLQEWITQGVLARFPSTAPADALPFIGRDRVLQRGPDEPTEAYRVRLMRWLSAWRLAGHAYAVLDQVASYLTPHAVTVRIVTNSGMWYTRAPDGTFSWYRADPLNWDWDAQASSWWRFWVILYPPPSLWVPEVWGDPGPWGDDAGSFGGQATVAQYEAITELVRQWKPKHAHHMHTIIAYDAGKFDPTAPAGPAMPDGSWGPWSKGSPLGPARDPECEYWPGAGS